MMRSEEVDLEDAWDREKVMLFEECTKTENLHVIASDLSNLYTRSRQGRVRARVTLPQTALHKSRCMRVMMFCM